MGTLINGIKEIFASASQTSPTNIPTCAADGTPNGNITIANLASVLGGYDSTLNSSDNLNNVLTSGIYYIDSLPSNAPSVLKEPVRSFMVVHTKNVSHSTTYTTQIIHSVVGSTNRMWVRNYDMPDWSAWKEVSFDVPTFYKNYSTLASLASALGVHKENYINEDIDNITPNSGFYIVHDYIADGTTDIVGTYHFPINTQEIYVFGWAYDANHRIELCLQVMSGDQYIRYSWGGYAPWKKIKTESL